MNIFILEDEIKKWPRKQIVEALTGHDLTVATSRNEAEALYQAGKYDLLLLDHDMRGFYDPSDYWNTGYQWCLWMLEREKSRPSVIIHSQNPTGSANMQNLLEENGFNVTRFYFSQAYIDYLKGI